MLNVYKVRAVIDYKKDENGVETNEIESIHPIVSVPFVGDIDEKNEWYIIKTPHELAESDDIIKIDIDKVDSLIGSMLADRVRSWVCGGEK